MTARRSNRIGDLGELQLEVLDILHRLTQGTVYEVLEQFSEAKRPRYTTVLTVLRALEQKGLATHRADGRSHVFRPTAASRKLRKRVLGDVLDRVFGGSPRDLMVALLDAEAVTPEVLRELRELLRSREEASDGDGPGTPRGGGHDGGRGGGRGG